MSYNICVVKPEGFVHAAAYFELAEVLGYSLRDLGTRRVHEFQRGSHRRHEHRHRLPPARCEPDRADACLDLIVNTEQIGDDMPWSASILQWAATFETWDYSERNLARLDAAGAVKTRLLGIGYHDKMARIAKAAQQDIDVLFYGSVNARRLKILRQLQASGCALHAVFGVFGEERDKLIARSKVVLNMHQFDAQIFEVVRVFYPDDQRQGGGHGGRCANVRSTRATCLVCARRVTSNSGANACGSHGMTSVEPGSRARHWPPSSAFRKRHSRGLAFPSAVSRESLHCAASFRNR